MEDLDPLVALQACIAAVRRGGMGEEGAEIQRFLRRVGEAMSENDREIEWLREALEQSREEKSRDFGQLAASMVDVQGFGGCVTPVGVVGGVATGPQDLEWKGGNDGTTESVSESVGGSVSASCEEGERQLQWTTADAAGEGTSRALDTNTTANNHTQQNELASEANGTHSSKGEEGMDTVTGVCAVRPAAASGHSDVDGVSETLESLDRERGEEGGEGNTVSAGDDKKGVATGSGVEETEGYQKVEFSALYYHSATGYYYDATTQQFFAPVSTDYQPTGQSHPSTGQTQTQTQTATSGSNGGRDGEEQATYESGPSGPTPKQPSTVADLLAAVSEHASQKCGLSYDEASGLYYDHRYAMYYDQARQLYYDPEGGTYYEFDTETCQYQVHSRVKLSKKTARSEEGLEKVVDLCSSSDSEDEGPLEEGELRGPSYPEMSPPPEEEWAPCLRMVVGSSECVPRGTVFVVTQEGAQLGREPGGANPISLHEVQVSKAHMDIRFSRTNGCFTICDLASQNGTFLNNARISEPKTESKPHPLNHNDILAIGTTSFTLHIHSGWDTCEFCRWEERGGGGEGTGKEGRGTWKSELNRIKKRYGLRMKDTYGEDPVRAPDGYVDRAAGRRQTVGSDMPDVSYPDAAPASVHRAIGEESVGHKMLQKLGWKKGEGLGKGSKGRTEPVTAEVREVRTGLGSGGGGKRSLDAGGRESAAKHARLVKHYSQVVAKESERSRRQ